MEPDTPVAVADGVPPREVAAMRDKTLADMLCANDSCSCIVEVSGWFCSDECQAWDEVMRGNEGTKLCSCSHPACQVGEYRQRVTYRDIEQRV